MDYTIMFIILFSFYTCMSIIVLYLEQFVTYGVMKGALK